MFVDSEIAGGFFYAVDVSLSACQGFSTSNALAWKLPSAIGAQLWKLSAAYGRDRAAVSETLGIRTTEAVFHRLSKVDLTNLSKIITNSENDTEVAG